MNREELIKEFDKQQLEILLNDLQDIDKFTGFKDGAFKYELGKYQAILLVNCIKKQKEVIDKVKKIILQPNIEIREYRSCDMDYVYINEQLLEILEEVSRWIEKKEY